MSIAIEIKLSPEEYKGWKLNWRESHDAKNQFCGTKAKEYVFADTPAALLRQLDEKERLTARLNPPVKALYRDKYGGKFVPCVIHSVCQDTLYLRLADGKETTSLMDYLKPDAKERHHDHRDLFIHDIKANHALLKKGVALRRRAAGLHQQAEELVKQVRQVLDVEVRLAAQ